jgi:uncharacterized protein with ParB-like and HNH nuclease domain
MSIQNLFATDTKNLQELFSNSKRYIIPEFQREYSWTEINWEDLFDDIYLIFNNNLLTSSPEKPPEKHYIGSIVLESSDINGKELIVIDGQQRLTTIYLLLLSAIVVLLELAKKDDNNAKTFAERFAQLLRFEKMTEIGHPISRLRLNTNENQSIFEMYFVPSLDLRQLDCEILLKKSSSKINKNKVLKSMHNAFLYFVERIKNNVINKSDTNPSMRLAKFVNDMLENIIFISIMASDTISAYTVFETLNARGVDLSPADLIKSYALSICAKQGQDQRKEDHARDWQLLSDRIGYRRMPDFIRDYLNSMATQFTKNKDLFRQIQQIYKTSADVTKLIKELRENSELYLTLIGEEINYWRDSEKVDYTKEQSQYIIEVINVLSNIFGVKQHIPLLMACINHKIPIIEILKIVEIIMFRYYKVCGKNANQLERTFHSIANKINRQEIRNVLQIKEQLQLLYVQDSVFLESFADIVLTSSNKKLIKYILIKMELYLGSADLFKSYSSLDHETTIEHIIPQSQATKSKSIHSISNLLLIEDDDFGNSHVADKIEKYKQSELCLPHLFVEAYEQFQQLYPDRNGRINKMKQNPIHLINNYGYRKLLPVIQKTWGLQEFNIHVEDNN